MELLTRIGHAFRYARLRKFTLGRLNGRPTSAVEVGRRRSLRKKKTERLCHRTATRQVLMRLRPLPLHNSRCFTVASVLYNVVGSNNPKRSSFRGRPFVGRKRFANFVFSSILGRRPK